MDQDRGVVLCFARFFSSGEFGLFVFVFLLCIMLGAMSIMLSFSFLMTVAAGWKFRAPRIAVGRRRSSCGGSFLLMMSLFCLFYEYYIGCRYGVLFLVSYHLLYFGNNFYHSAIGT